MKRRVAMISEHASPLRSIGGVDDGGQNVYVGQLARNLADLGYEVDLFTRRDDRAQPPVVQWTSRVRVFHVSAGPQRRIPKEELLPHIGAFTEQLLRHCRRESYDLVHANFWMSGLVAAELKRALGSFRVVVSDQTDDDGLLATPELLAVTRFLEARGHSVDLHRHLPRRGMAEQRQFLLDRATAPYVCFIDDDVLTEPDLLTRLLRALRRERCGFVGSAVIGLSYRDDHRPQEEAIQFWEGRVRPERVVPGDAAWSRHRLHNAANLYHVQQRLRIKPEEARCYRVAWVGGCVLYDRAALRACGGFRFWEQLPDGAVGEDVLAQLRVMKRFGGAGLIPSGAYHQELPTTLVERGHDAPWLLAGAH